VAGEPKKVEKQSFGILGPIKPLTDKEKKGWMASSSPNKSYRPQGKPALVDSGI